MTGYQASANFDRWLLMLLCSLNTIMTLRFGTAKREQRVDPDQTAPEGCWKISKYHLNIQSSVPLICFSLRKKFVSRWESRKWRMTNLTGTVKSICQDRMTWINYVRVSLNWSTTKPTKWLHPVKTQISLHIRPVWSESLLSAWRRFGFLATHKMHSKVFRRLIRLGRCPGSYVFTGCMGHFVGFCHIVTHIILEGH